ncbi:phosphotransferase family protein [Desertibacillus haloalkaliphilus]|uniref:phosphotransferase family protein n=1 Tax=Desertibacillus haloalkaliphilus TaxID=1328930 RepID=UPI001C2656DC|nr:phosphotransferase family protein [Desertibacillus haloalkaliphilus]MBU8905647.1 phosphotransferase family protein [Desertibacillus haloalkaliphilus]
MTGKDTIPVRKGEELDVSSLEQFLKNNIVGLSDDRLEISQFAAGHSNLTYEVKIGDWEGVLRRPPLGPVAPKAHDMNREYKILREVHPHFQLAPKPLVYSDDQSVIGSPFFVMERRRGVVIDKKFPEGVEVTPTLCKKISETMVSTLVDLHSIDYKQTKLTELSKPEGFIERQVHGWIKRYDRSKTDNVHGVEQLKQWLTNHIPRSSSSSVIHYDFKLNNAMFAKNDLTKIVGLFDWEMTTVGDPLADLGVFLSYWIEREDPEQLRVGFDKEPITTLPGFMTRQEMIEMYAKQSGRDVANIHFYLTFAYFKLAVIVQQIYYRYRKGQTNDERFATLNRKVDSLINHALFLTEVGE